MRSSTRGSDPGVHEATRSGSLTERELRRAAFKSHAKAYDRAGFARVALVAPQLVPVIATIPAAEFLPTSRNFLPSVCQVFETFDRVAPQVIGMGWWGPPLRR